MKNVLRVLGRDLLRLLKTPAALVVVVALVVLPSVYTWYNVLGFWNPYEDTGNLRVGVVNQDEGGSSELTGELDVGDQIVQKLAENGQLGWEFDYRESAMADLQSGESYAVFVIPEDFTKSLLGLVSGGSDAPDIEYYVNEKAGPVAPKITDTGATTLDETINAAFVSTVSDVVAQSVDAAVSDARASVEQGTSAALQKAEEALAKISDARDAVEGVRQGADAAKSDVRAAEGTRASADAKLEALSGEIPRLQQAADDAGDKMTDFSDAAMEAHAAIVQALADLEGLIPPEDYERLKQQAERVSQVLDGAILPAAGNALFALRSASGALAGAIAGQQAASDELGIVLGGLDGVLDAATDSLSQTEGLLDGAYADMDGIKGDLLSLSEADLFANVVGADGLDAGRIASFMGSPTEVVTEQMYELNAYGSAMAPLFMNLTFWIGAFMLLVIMRQEVDGEGIPRLTLTQRYLGRFLLFAILAVLQAVVCVAGVLAIGVEAASPPALFFASAVASLSYLSIIYALSVTLQHIGKGICIVLVFAQIPGATGLYPIEMTSSFFQAVYPLLPFTYGIGAMREAIFGFYGTHYAEALGVLVFMFAAAMLVGILVRPLTGNVNRMVASQVRRSGILNGERVEIPARRQRASQVVRLLVDQDEFRSAATARYEKLEKWYPRLVRGAAVLGVVVPVALVAVFALTPATKVVLLTVWLAWVVAAFVFLVVLETLRFNVRRQLRLGGVAGDKLLGMYAAGEKGAAPRRGHGDAGEGGDTGDAGEGGKAVPAEGAPEGGSAEAADCAPASEGGDDA